LSQGRLRPISKSKKQMDRQPKNLLPNLSQECSTPLFWLLAVFPAICVAASYMYLTYPDSIYSILPNSIVSTLLGKAVIIPVLAVFFINLVVPCATDRNKSFLFTLPPFIVHFYFFSFSLFWMTIMEFTYPGDTPGAYKGTLILAVISIPLEILFFILALLFASFGAWLRESRK
jgi:hypothetical protein